MRGSCLCGEVEFELVGEVPDLYQCHCSLCRRVSGSSANAALIIDASLRGETQISRYESAGGFKSHFCGRCGSPLPNPTRGGSAWWVPVGLLEDNGKLRRAAHVFVASRASWDQVAVDAPRFDEMPDAEHLDGLLRRRKALT